MAKRKPDEEIDEAPPDESKEPDAVTADSSSTTVADSATEGAEAVVEPRPLYEEIGLDESYKGIEDPKEIAKRLVEERKTANERFEQQLAERQRQWQQETQNWLQQKKWREEHEAKVAEKPADMPKWWNPPASYVKDWRKYVKKDPETGEMVIDAPTEALKNAVLESVKFVAEHEDRWETDREGYLRSFVEATVPDIIRQSVQSIMAEQAEAQSLAQLENESASWLYQRQDDEFVRDLDGNLFLTPVGVDVMNYARALHAKGLGSRPECFVAARDAIVGRHLLAERAQIASAEKARKTSDERKLDALDKNGKRRANRGGSDAKVETRDAPPQTTSTRQLFAQDLDRYFTPEGNLVQTV